MILISKASNQPNVTYLPYEYPLAQKSNKTNPISFCKQKSKNTKPSVQFPEWEWQYIKN